MLGSSFMFANMPHMLADREVPYAADGIHPSILGSHIAAEVLAAVIQAHKEKKL